MSNIQDVVDSQRRIETSLMAKMAEFERQLQSSTQCSKPSLDKLTQEFYEFKKLSLSMFGLLNTQINTLLAQVDVLDTQQRRNVLMFNGIQETEHENCSVTVLNIIKDKLHIGEVETDSFLLCHRLGIKSDKKNRPILVRFTNLHLRDAVWKSKKLLKNTTLVITEFLTKTRQAIYTDARKHFGVTCCWTRDGNVYVKLSDNDRKRITSPQELDALMSKYPSAASISVPSPKVHPTSKQTITAVAAEPPLTRRNAVAKGRLNKH